MRPTFARQLEIESNHPYQRRRPSTGRLRNHADSLLEFLLVPASLVCPSSQRRGQVLSTACATSRLAEDQSQVVDENGISSRNHFADRVGLGEHSESRIGGYAETRTMRGKRDRARRNSRSGSRREPLDDAPAMAHRKPAPLNVRSNPKLRTTVR